MSPKQLFSDLTLWVTANPLLTTLILVAGAAAASILVEFLAKTLNEGRFAWQRRLRRRIGVEDGCPIHELRWMTLGYQILLWPFIGFLLLHVWGQHELGENVSNVLAGDGVALGSVTVVPINFLYGLLWFVLLVTFTRWLKTKLEDDWLPLARVEPSVRVSVATLFGYATFIIAAMIGLNVAGLDLSKLAIVAGALSVGIGFGLQNIVNNFISGLILQFERPVRLGDYIKVGGMEGFVRRVRIRSTELETWDRTSIIVPNSELLSSKVENTGFHDQTGRVILPIGVDYNADPDQVRTLLLKAVEGIDGIIQDGEITGLSGPWVLFTDFGDSALQFELRAYVHDQNAKAGVASKLRFRIFELFKQAEINIPFPQSDVWVRNWPERDAAERPPLGPGGLEAVQGARPTL